MKYLIMKYLGELLMHGELSLLALILRNLIVISSAHIFTNAILKIWITRNKKII